MANYEQLSLLGPLKQYQIRFIAEQIATPADFSASACLMRGAQILPTAPGNEVEAFLQEDSDDSLINPIELELLKLSHAGWPEDAMIAVGGIANFGAKNIPKSKAMGQRALRLNPDCTLALQLVKLLATPGGDPHQDAPMSSQNRINSDEIPPAFHQAEVHRTALEFLQCLMAKDLQKQGQIEVRFREDPLFGLEVCDEAIVLHKNDPDVWPLDIEGKLILSMGYKVFYDHVVQLRDGRPRATTTPTLRGGGTRGPSA